jgi:hypothetical protein
VNVEEVDSMLQAEDGSVRKIKIKTMRARQRRACIVVISGAQLVGRRRVNGDSNFV